MANDFSGDGDVVALYRLEDGALETDSKGSNDLTGVNTPQASTVTFKEGAASLVAAPGDAEYLRIDDTDMSADYPLKDGSANDTFSILFWFRPDDQATRYGLFSKYEFGSDLRSISCEVDDGIRINLGHTGGTDQERVIDFADVPALTDDVWYHFKFTYDDQDWTFRLWDDNGSSVHDTDSGTTSNAISILETPFVIASYAPVSAGRYWDGFIDEFLLFKRVVSDADQDDIIAGTYSAGGTTFNVTVSDGADFGESAAGALTIGATVSDGLLAGDAPGGALTLAQAVSDGAIFGDAAIGGLQVDVSITDGIVVGDERIANLVQALTVADGVSFGDAILTAITFLVSITDGAVFGDVAIDSSALADAPVTLTFSTKAGTITFTANSPAVAFTASKPEITMTGDN